MPVFAAALLHDAVGDQGISRQAIAAMFVGSRWVVLEVTDDKRGHGGAQALQVDQAPKKAQQVKVLEMADKASTVGGLAGRASAGLRLVGCDLIAGLRGASPEVERMFDESVDEPTRLIAAGPR